MPAVLDSDFTPLPVPRLGEAPLDVRAETERARTRGYADGFAHGLGLAARRADEERAAERRRDERQRLADLRERAAALTAIRRSQDRLDERVAMLSELSAWRIEELATQLAEAILGAELSDPARSASHALRRALEHTPVDRWVRVTLDERDARVLLEDADAAQLLETIEVVSACGLGPGGAVVEIQDGAVDTRVGAALARASAALRGPEDDGRAGDGEHA